MKKYNFFNNIKIEVEFKPTKKIFNNLKMTKKLKISIHKRLPKKKNKRHRSKDKRNITNKLDKISNTQTKEHSHKSGTKKQNVQIQTLDIQIEQEEFIEMEPFQNQLDGDDQEQELNFNNSISQVNQNDIGDFQNKIP